MRDIQTVAMWEGDAVEFDLPLSVMSAGGYEGCAILLQTEKSKGIPSAIIGATVVMDGGSTWEVLGSGLPTAPVVDMAYHDASKTLVIVTHGLGAFSLVYE